MSIKGSVTVHVRTFIYGEQSSSKSRGISMHEPGVANSQHQYKFDPNPHDDPKYNKNQEKFYQAAATAIGEIIRATDQWPAFNTQISVFAVPYTLVEW